MLVVLGFWPAYGHSIPGHQRACRSADCCLDAAGGGRHEAGGVRGLARCDDLVPTRARRWAHPIWGLSSWRDVFAVLALVGIVYGATVALVQKDFKFVIGIFEREPHGFRPARFDER